MDHRTQSAGSPSAPAAAAEGVTLRQLASHADYHACFELQLATWGRDFEEGVPPSVLKISQRVGGIAAGAFAADGRLLGFVFGLTGVRSAGSRRSAVSASPGASDGHSGEPAAGRPELLHWSHMLAVAPDARDLGLGRHLKLYQRELLLPLGVEVVEWTYDPLEARNAHLNLNRLGADVVDYVEEMYKGEMGSELARGIGTDRFVVSWRIAGERARAALERQGTGRGAGPGDGGGADATPPAGFEGAPGIEPAPPAGGDPPLPDAPRVRIEVPARIQEFKEAEPERALAWRLGTRRAFRGYLARGYLVTAFWRDAAGRCWYGVEAAGR
jgi:chorismate synthase